MKYSSLKKIYGIGTISDQVETPLKTKQNSTGKYNEKLNALRAKYGLGRIVDATTRTNASDNDHIPAQIRKPKSRYAQKLDALRQRYLGTSYTPFSEYDSAEAYEQAINDTQASTVTYAEPVHSEPSIDLSQYDSPAAAVGAYIGGWISNKLKGEEGDTRTWFQKGTFEDGYQVGDVTKGISATTVDAKGDLATGVVGIGEKIIDFLAYIAPYVAQGQYYQNGGGYNITLDQQYNAMIEQTKDVTAEFVQKDIIDEEEVGTWAAENLTLDGQINKALGIDTEGDSFLGEKSDALVQSAGELAGQYGLSLVGIPWFVTTGATSMGSEVESALNQGASYEEAGLSGVISAGAEILTEKLFDGDLFVNSAGFDGVVKKLTEQITDKFLKKAAKFGLNTAGEGVEEWLSTRIGQFGQWLAYGHDEKSLLQTLYSEEAMDQAIEAYIGGTLLGGTMNAINAVVSNDTSQQQGRSSDAGYAAVDTAIQTDYDSITQQGGYLYAEGQVGYRDDWGLSQRDAFERRTQGEGDGPQSGRILSKQGSSEGAGGPSVYDPGDRGSGAPVNYGGIGAYDGNSTVDSEGNVFSEEIAKQIKGTTVLDDGGRPIKVYHGTPDMDFTNFAKGDTGFHFGTVEQAKKRLRDKKTKQGRVFQGYVVLRNPVVSETDIGRWDADPFSLFLRCEGILSDAEYAEVQNLLTGDRNLDKQYDAPAAMRLREILENKGYDGAIYSNFFEGDALSYMVFRDSQFIRTGIHEYTDESANQQPQQQDEGKTQTDPNRTQPTSQAPSDLPLLDRQALESYLASDKAKTLPPKSRSVLRSYLSKLQHLDTIKTLIDQKKGLQKTDSPNTYDQQRADADIKTLEQKLQQQQKKIREAEQDAALLKTIEESRLNQSLQNAAVSEGAESLLQVFKLTSEYRNAAGEFDIDRAKSDYSDFLTTAPERHRMYLQQAYESVGYEQRKLREAAFGYSMRDDVIYYDASNPDFWFMDFAVANTHELAHRIDAYFVNAADNKAFHDAIVNAKQIIAEDPQMFVDYSLKNDLDGFLSDVLSAIDGGEHKFFAGHAAEDWQTEGSQEREIYANLFSLEACNDQEKLQFIKKHFPEIYEAYMDLEYEVK